MSIFLEDIERLSSSVEYALNNAIGDTKFSSTCCTKEPSDSNKKCLYFASKKELILRDMFDLSH